MDRITFFASEVAWQSEARCGGQPLAMFAPDVETPESLVQVQDRYCNACPVRTECLAYALLYRMSGYWGGTSTAERRLLGYARNRVRCPVCKSKALVRTPDGCEICQGCGVSWRSAPQPCLPEEAVG